MPPKRAKKRKLPAAFRGSSSSTDFEAKAEPSQESEVASTVKVAQELKAANLRRRDASREVIKLQFTQRVKEMHDNINTYFDERKTKIIKAQSAQWATLQALLKKRQAIEARIFQDIKEIERTSLNLAHELAAIYDGRMDEIRNMGMPDDLGNI